MIIVFSQPIWFYRQPINFRLQIDGLALLVADRLEHDPTSGQLFVFRNRQANKLKLLWWDDHGFWLFYKWIEKGRFKFPPIEDETLELSKDQLLVLIAGLEFMGQSYIKKITAQHFY